MSGGSAKIFWGNPGQRDKAEMKKGKPVEPVSEENGGRAGEDRRMKCAPRLEKRKNDGLKTGLKPLDLEANKIEGVLKSARYDTKEPPSTPDRLNSPDFLTLICPFNDMSNKT